MRGEETEEHLRGYLQGSLQGSQAKPLPGSPLAHGGAVLTQQALLGCVVPEENHLLPALLAQGGCVGQPGLSQVVFEEEECGRAGCKRIEMALKAISPLMNCSCTNYQRVGTALPLTGHSCVQ